MKILGIGGSLRKGSYNSATLRAAKSLCKQGTTLEIAEIGDLPLYNDDVRAVGFPAPVERLRTQIASADALLIATAEYNYSVSGVLKNAIDWASRPPTQPFDGKPCAIVGASPGAGGSLRAQYHLRQMLVFLNALPINKPELAIAAAASKFDEAGNLTDEATKTAIGALLESLTTWTNRLRGAAP